MTPRIHPTVPAPRTSVGRGRRSLVEVGGIVKIGIVDVVKAAESEAVLVVVPSAKGVCVILVVERCHAFAVMLLLLVVIRRISLPARLSTALRIPPTTALPSALLFVIATAASAGGGMVLLLPPRRAITADEIISHDSHALPWQLSAAVPLDASASATSGSTTSVISQISLPIVGHGVVTRHDGRNWYREGNEQCLRY